ncbi:LysR family transcriptional regulator [Rahnella ecdela]|jgi:DNA-binding transcriptional LysR family regulator|uniref:LysR family transcriptional regulator n=1 Tax=Rahnella ecdela TaxID=2816250 RepID=A0ABS6LB26_9GAMM|nr:LysR family transcriptional regulator [Rahnella ecdela]MBU9843812.1 LysR family transcriptional regulator [Rahnella ecdela]
MALSSPTGFDYNLIPYLITIVETSSMVAAAEVLGVAPSAVSYAVKKLRNHYNDQLFIRRLNGVKPTSLAINLYERYKLINEDITNIMDLSSVTQKTRRKIFIRADPIMELWISDRLISSGLVPEECTLEFRNDAITAEDRVNKIRNFEIDLDIGLQFAGDRNVISETLFEWQYLLICREQHLSIGENLSREQFENEQYVAYGNRFHNTTTLNNLNELVISRNFEPLITSESPLTMLINILYHDLLMFIPSTYFPVLQKKLPIKKVQCDFLPKLNITHLVHMHKKNANDVLLKKIISFLKE